MHSISTPRHAKRLIGYLFSLFAFMMVGVSVVSAATTLDDIKARGELIAGVKAQYEPFGFVDKDGTHLGFDVDIAHELAKALLGDPNKVKFVSVTSGNRVPYLQSKKIDIITATMSVTPERAKVVDFSEPYFLSGSLVLVPGNSSITGVKDLAGKTVAVIQGAIQVNEVKELAPTAKLVEYGKLSECVLALKTGRADAYVHDDLPILAVAEKDPTLKVVGDAFKPVPFAIAVRKGDTEFLEFVNQQLENIKKDGTFDKLWDKWFGQYKDRLLKPE